jgi:hypothetical protein
MGDALAVIVLVVAGASSRPATDEIPNAILHAAHRDARVEVREVRSLPAEEPRAPADVVAEVVWSDASDHVTLRVRRADGMMLNEMALDFAATEAWAERGKSVGFAIATMLPETSRAPVPSTSLVATALDGDPIETSTAPVATSFDESAASERRRAPPPATEAPGPLAVALSGGASIDAHGKATGAGPSAVFEWAFSRSVSLRAGGDARWFDVDTHAANELGLRAGMRLTLLRAGTASFGTAADLMVVRDAYQARRETVTWSVGGGGSGEAALAISPRFEMFLSCGAGWIRRELADPTVTTLSPVWFGARTGGRISF